MKKLWQMFFLSIGLFLLVCSQGDLVQAAPVSSGSWKIIASSNPPGDDSLFAVAAISLNDAWAVGSSGQDGPSPMTLTEHFNGTQWSVIPSPNPGPSSNKLYSVAATTMNDVWAVGYSYNSPPQTLILHYDGTQWSVIASPSPGSFNNQLLSVSAISAHDAWAVGYAASNTTTQALIEHYNGSSWEVIPGPALSSSYYELDAVTALSSTNVVAVGSFINQQGNSQALIEHWNGSRWKVLSGPNPGSSSRLNGVVAVSSSDVWAVGQSGISNGDAPHGSFSQSQVFPRTLIEHFDGSKWRIAASPNLGTSDTLTGVSSVSGTGHAWAVGSYYNSAPPVQTLTEFYG